MKKIIILSGISGLLCACSTIPVPVNPGIVYPNMLPKNPLIAYAVPQADPFMVQPNVANVMLQRNTPAIATPVSTLAAAKAIPASYSPDPIPAIALPNPTNNKMTSLPQAIVPANTITPPQMVSCRI